MNEPKLTTLYSYHNNVNLTLEETIAQCSQVLEGAIALLYSPQSCQFLRLNNKRFQYSSGEEKEVQELSDIFEARIFNPSSELRWLNQNLGSGKAVLLSEEIEQSPENFTALDPIPCDSLKQEYLLWGQKAKNQTTQEGWQTLSEARIGKLNIPLTTTLEESQQVYLETREYIAELVKEDSNSENYGNFAVIEERLVKLKPKPLEEKK